MKVDQEEKKRNRKERKKKRIKKKTKKKTHTHTNKIERKRILIMHSPKITTTKAIYLLLKDK